MSLAGLQSSWGSGSGSTPSGGVTSLNALTAGVVLVSPAQTITITPNALNNTIVLEAVATTPVDAVDSLNGVIGDVTLTSSDASVTITPDEATKTINLSVTIPTGFNLEGIYNKLGAFPATPLTSDTVALAINNTGTPATAIVPDGTPPTGSTTPEGALCWLYTKPSPAFTGFNWYMYNPRFGAPTAPLPIIKNKLQSLWALIQPAVNTNIYQAGVIALNAYTYDDANPPTSGFYNTRWAYSNQAGANSGQSGINLYAGYTYLVYAFDAPRVVNVQGVGMPDSQEWGLRDPYDIHPEVNHIALANTVIAFNPWTDGTNYRTWNATTAWVVGDTVIFSGTTGTPTGLFYSCAVNNTATPPVSATGVPSPSWTVISPQPSSYASKPVSLLNINGISGTASGWTAGQLLRVLEIGYSYGPDATTLTGSVRYRLG